MALSKSNYEAAVDEFLWKALYQERQKCTEFDVARAFASKWPSDVDVKAVHEDLRNQYSEYMEEDSKAAYAFLESHPQMQAVHGEWRRVQQGYEPVSGYDLDSELEASRFLSKYDPDLSISDMTTLFPEEIHDINAESFYDVCRRYGRDYFQANGSYDTGNEVVDSMFELYDEEAFEAAVRRLESLSEELGIEEDVDDNSLDTEGIDVPF